jgi:hypothetical protein
VTPDEATSLEVVAIYSPPPPGTDTHGPPLELMAIARDGTGERLLGVDTQWEVTEGRLWLHHLGGLFGGEAPPDRSRIRIGESCTPNRNEATRRATVVARVGDLEKSLELEWTVSSLHTPEPYDPDAAERYCEGPGDSSQGCRVGGAAPSWAWLVLGLAAMYGLGSPRRRSLRPGHWDRTR